MTTFAAALKALREDRGLSQRKLRLRAGLTEGTLSRIESAQRNPSRAMVERLADALDATDIERARLLVAGGYWPGIDGAALIVRQAREGGV